MSESGVVPREAGLRLRDSNLGTMARQLEQDKIEAARLAKQQLEQERRDRKTAEEKEKRRAANEAKAAQAFREYHDLKPSQSRGHVVVRYIEARGGVVNADNYQKGLDDLNDPAFLKLYCPEKATRMENFAIAKAWAADVKPIYVAKCKFCRICFETEEELVRHLEITRPCPKCRSVCSSGGEIHRCSTFGGSIVEDRIPAVIKNDEEEL